MPSPVLGYNTNVRHHGKLFHIQTEDSGVSHGHIFTHLFADGGRIIATKKTTYAQHIGTERFPAVVKKLMQAQHKAMFIALRDGLFDEDEIAGAAAFTAREITLPEDEAEAPAPPPPPASPAVSTTGLDVDALERAAAGYLESAASLAPAPDTKRSPSGRYAATQPAVRPRTPPPAAPRSDSVFGSDFLSEKSLDEVIMSYLAEDLESDE